MVNEIQSYVKTWENRCYKNGIPDEADQRLESLGLVPSYKRIAFAILRNDVTLKTLGFNPKKSKYYHILKKMEIDQRKGYVRQLELFS